MNDSNKPTKPAKPHPGFPLTPHATGRWCKKIRGRMYYFGTWDDPDGALEEWLAAKDDLLAGRTPAVQRGKLLLKGLCNYFLTSKQAAVEAGELRRRTFVDYHDACKRLVAHFGGNRPVEALRPQDFEGFRNKLAKRYGPALLAVELARIRMVLKYATDNELVDRPIRCGTALKQPPRRSLRLAKQANGQRLFTRKEIHRLLDAANITMRPMILLATNCGFGGMDCATLPMKAVDLAGQMIHYPRPKTGAPRRCPLWPETVAALAVYLENRPKPKKPVADLVFLRPAGGPWLERGDTCTVPRTFRELAEEAGVWQFRRGFYALRHTFATIGAEVRDDRALKLIMGHEAGDMLAAYVERIGDDRLRAVVEHVRRWLYQTKE